MFWTSLAPVAAAALLLTLIPATTLALSSSIRKIPNFLTGKIASDERVIFFPTVGSRINETHWSAHIHGWIFEPETESRKRKVAIRGLGKVLDVKTDTEGGKLLKRRLMPFTVDNQSMKFVLVKVGNNGTGGIHRLPRSTKNGHFVGHVTLHHDELHDAEDGMVTYRAVDRDRIFEGFIHLLQSTGTSIISDIDDTVKITNYLDKKEFLKNTFLREFVEVPGMKELFHRCKSNYDNCSFHYVSASPYQLFEELQEFFVRVGFPSGSFHLKTIRIKDRTLLQLFADPMDYKLRQIEPLLKTYPMRKFILIGDSGEKDPEIYAELYRRYPGRIEQIWIRNVNNANASRMEGVDPRVWRYFRDGHDLI